MRWTGWRAFTRRRTAWDQAAETLRKLIAALARTSTPEGEEAKLAARHRLGAILKDRLADVRGAEEQLVEVLASPGGDRHVPTMLTLVAIYRERRDWLKARQLLGRAAAGVDDADERVRLLTEAADICAHELDDEAQAAEIYAEALAIDPQRIDLIERLAAIRFKRSDWTGLLPLAEFLVAEGDGTPEDADACAQQRGEGAAVVPAGARRRGDGRPHARQRGVSGLAGGAARR